MADLPFASYREAGGLIFFSGKVETTPELKILDGSITEKTRQVMRNVKTELKNAGLDVSNIINVQVFLTDMKNYQEFNEEYVKHLMKPYPARFVVAVKELPLGASVEVVMVAVRK